MSRSKDSNNRSKLKNAPPISVIILLVAFILLAFGFIGFRQLQSAQERRLRLLVGFSERIETTVEDLTERFVRVVGAQDDADAIEAYLDNVPNLALVETSPRPPRCGRTEDDRRDSFGLIRLTAEDRFAFLSYCPPSQQGSPDAYRADIDLDALIAPMVLPGVFDSVVLANRQGRVLFQEGEPELRMADLGAVLAADTPEDSSWGLDRLWSLAGDELSSRDRKALEPLLRKLEDEGRNPSLVGGTGMETIQIADRDYYAFFQPVKPHITPPKDHDVGEPARWIAVGLISSENLLSSGLTTSPVMLFVLVSILPLALITWPFLKLALITRQQRFNQVDLASLLFATVIGVSLGVLLVFDLLFLARLRTTVDDQLEDLSAAVTKRFFAEVHDAHNQLQELNQTIKLPDFREFEKATDPDERCEWSSGGSDDKLPKVDGLEDLQPVQSIVEFTKDKYPDPAGHYLEERVGALLGEQDIEISEYPSFDSVFWATPYGHHACSTIPLRRHAILPSNVADREYFRCVTESEPEPYRVDPAAVVEDPALPCGDRTLESTDAEPIKLCFQSVLDRTTGESVAVLATEGPGTEGPEGTRDDFPVAAMVTRLASVAHPLLPPELGFAIVEPSGRVLFHSDSRRELTENFLKASDEDPLLGSLIRERRDGHLPLSYWGQRSRAHVRELDGLPWSLVTFRSLQDLRVRNFEVIYDFLNLYVLFLVVYALLGGLVLWSGRRSRRISVWPSSRNLPLYWRIVVGTPLLISVLVALMLLTEAPGWILAATFFGPLVVLLVVLLLPLIGQLVVLLLSVLLTTDRSGGNSGEDESSEEGSAESRSDSEAEATEEVKSAKNRLLSSWSQRRERQDAWVPWVFRGILAAGVIVSILAGAPAEVTLLVALAAATGAGAVWWKLEFRGTRRRTAYILTAGCILTLTALVPALVFFSLARSRQVQLLTQETQVSLARRLEERQREIEERRSPLYDNGGIFPTDEALRQTFDRTRDSYLCTLFGTRILPKEGGGGAGGDASPPSHDRPRWAFGSTTESGDGQDPGWVDRMLAARPLPLNVLSTRPVRGDLSRYGFASGDWIARDDGRLVLKHLERFGTGAERSLASTPPTTGKTSGLPLIVQALFLLGVLGLVASPWLLSRFIAREVLLVNLVGAPESDDETRRTPGAPEHMTEHIAVILNEAREPGKIVRRVVLVSTVPDRGAWSNMVGPEDNEYQEASFAGAWREALRGPVAEPDDDDAGDKGPKGGATGRPEGGEGSAKPVESRSDRFARLLGGEDSKKKRPLLLLHFEPELEDEGAAIDQITALEKLIDEEERSVVILSEQIPDLGLGQGPLLVDRGRRAVRNRWIEILGSFSVRHGQDYRTAALDNRAEKLLEDIDDAQVKSLDDPSHRQTAYRVREIVRQVAEECSSTPVLRQIGYEMLSEIKTALAAVGVSAKPAGGGPEGAEVKSSQRQGDEEKTQQERRDENRAWRLLQLITREYVFVKVGTEARLHYRHLWEQCTRDEQLVLVQLAEQGIVNPKYLGWVSDLMNRGLVARDPALRVMNESFRRFVRQEVRRSQILEWEEEGGPSGWNVLKWILPIPLVGLAAFLFITQQNALSSLAGIAVAAASLAPFVINLYNKVQEINFSRDSKDATGE